MGDDAPTASSTREQVRGHSLKPPRSTIVFLVAWNLILAPIIVVTAVTQSAWVMLPALAASAVFALIAIRRGRRRIMQHMTDRVVGRGHSVHLEAPAVSPAIDHIPRRWTGGGSVPTWLGRCEAPSPMVLLELRDGRVHMRLRPRVIARMFGANPLALSGRGLENAYPVKRWLHSGVALKPVGSAPHYLWTSESESILAALETWGFTVTWEQRKAER